MKIRNLFAPFRKRSRALDEEMQFHLEKQVEANIAAGMPPDEARRQAMIAFGGVQQTREKVSEVCWTHFVEVLLQDGRYAWRLLRKSSLFTSVVVVTLALGIGLNTAIFSLIDAILFRPLPASHPEQLVLLRWHALRSPKNVHSSSSYGYCEARFAPDNPYGCSLSLPWFESVRSSNLFSGVAAFAGAPRVELSGNGPATMVGDAQLVSGDFFTTTGIKPALGRTIEPSDDLPSASSVVVLSYQYWKKEFGGSPDAVGRTIRLNGVPFTIIGVAEERFEGLAPRRYDMWLPISARPVISRRFSPKENDAGSWWLSIVGRLKPGVSLKQAEAGLGILFSNEMEHGDKPLFAAADQAHLDLVPASEGLTGSRDRALQPFYVLMMTVVLVLLIACSNIGGLLLTRASQRSREMAVRLTLGARRGRIVSQLLMESLMLSAMGGALALLVGRWGARIFLLVSMGGATGRLPFTPKLDARVLAFTFAISVLSALLFGLAPALRILRVDPMPALKAGGSASDAAGRRRWFAMGNALVVGQVTLAIIALVSAGLMVRTLRNLKAEDLGFDPQNILMFEIDAGLAGYKGPQLDQLNTELQEKFAALPGVKSVSYSWFPMLDGGSSSTDFHPAGTPEKQTAETGVLAVGPGFFSTMHIPFLAGRDLSAADFSIAAASAERPPDSHPDPKAAPAPVVVNQLFVKMFFPHTNPVGEHIEESLPRNPKTPRGPGWTIVGVVADARSNNMRQEMQPMMYVPSAGDGVYFVVRSSADPQQLVPAIRDVVNRRDSNLAVSDVGTQMERIDRLLSAERMVAKLSTFFSVLALLLACAGIYGLLAYEVTRRTREIGIRMAIGAQQNDVMAMVVRHGLVLACAGAVIGVAASFGVSRLLQSLLYGVHAGDPATLIVVTILLLLVSMVACWLPARRATRVDPLVALRYE